MPSAFNAIYGQIIKLKTVIGIKIIKYNFSVVTLVQKDTWILQQAYIIRINPTKSSKTKVNWPAERKFAYFSYEIPRNDESGWDINQVIHWCIIFQKAKDVIHTR